MKRKVLILILVLVPVFFFAGWSPALAAKKRVWKTATIVGSGGSSNFSVSAKLTGWKQYLNISFKGVAGTNGVTYELIYNGNNTEQGVYGNVKASEGNVTRSIFFGTCSHGACTTHKNISNVHLTITYKTTDGQNMTKKYKVKY